MKKSNNHPRSSKMTTYPSDAVIENLGPLARAVNDLESTAKDDLDLSNFLVHDTGLTPEEKRSATVRQHGHPTLGGQGTYEDPNEDEDNEPEEDVPESHLPGDHQALSLPPDLWDERKSPETVAADVTDFIFRYLRDENLVSNFEVKVHDRKITVDYRKMPLPSPAHSSAGSDSAKGPGPWERSGDPFKEPEPSTSKGARAVPKPKDPAPEPPTEEVGLVEEPFRAVYKYPNKFGDEHTIIRMSTLKIDRARVKKALEKRNKVEWFNNPETPMRDRAVFATWFGGKSKILSRGAKVASYASIVS
ncbi:phosphoprotein [Tahe rhabdovirus 2]|nr:phosphoprotein [Tahe rhabdovirus 2]